MLTRQDNLVDGADAVETLVVQLLVLPSRDASPATFTWLGWSTA